MTQHGVLTSSERLKSWSQNLDEAILMAKKLSNEPRASGLIVAIIGDESHQGRSTGIKGFEDIFFKEGRRISRSEIQNIHLH